MTREFDLDDAIKHCEEVAEENYGRATAYLSDREVYKHEEQKCLKCADEHMQLAEWLRDYKRLKEQEPCEDAISREDVINLKWRGEASEEFLEGYANAIEDARVLPSVKPQERTGHWKRISIDKYSEHAKYWYRCNRCGKDNLGNTDWCPNCGAKMSENPTGSESEE